MPSKSKIDSTFVVGYEPEQDEVVILQHYFDRPPVRMAISPDQVPALVHALMAAADSRVTPLTRLQANLRLIRAVFGPPDATPEEKAKYRAAAAEKLEVNPTLLCALVGSSLDAEEIPDAYCKYAKIQKVKNDMYFLEIPKKQNPVVVTLDLGEMYGECSVTDGLPEEEAGS